MAVKHAPASSAYAGGRDSVGVKEDCNVLKQRLHEKLTDAKSQFELHKDVGHRRVVVNPHRKTSEDVRRLWHQGKEVLPWMHDYFTRREQGGGSVPHDYRLAADAHPWGRSSGTLYNVWTRYDAIGADGASTSPAEVGVSFQSLTDLNAYLCAQPAPSAVRCGGANARRHNFPEAGPLPARHAQGTEERHAFIRPLGGRVSYDDALLCERDAAGSLSPAPLAPPMRVLADIGNAVPNLGQNAAKGAMSESVVAKARRMAREEAQRIVAERKLKKHGAAAHSFAVYDEVPPPTGRSADPPLPTQHVAAVEEELPHDAADEPMYEAEPTSDPEPVDDAEPMYEEDDADLVEPCEPLPPVPDKAPAATLADVAAAEQARVAEAEAAKAKAAAKAAAEADAAKAEAAKAEAEAAEAAAEAETLRRTEEMAKLRETLEELREEAAEARERVDEARLEAEGASDDDDDDDCDTSTDSDAAASDVSDSTLSTHDESEEAVPETEAALDRKRTELEALQAALREEQQRAADARQEAEEVDEPPAGLDGSDAESNDSAGLSQDFADVSQLTCTPEEAELEALEREEAAAHRRAQLEALREQAGDARERAAAAREEAEEAEVAAGGLCDSSEGATSDDAGSDDDAVSEDSAAGASGVEDEAQAAHEAVADRKERLEELREQAGDAREAAEEARQEAEELDADSGEDSAASTSDDGTSDEEADESSEEDYIEVHRWAAALGAKHAQASQRQSAQTQQRAKQDHRRDALERLKRSVKQNTVQLDALTAQLLSLNEAAETAAKAADSRRAGAAEEHARNVLEQSRSLGQQEDELVAYAAGLRAELAARRTEMVGSLRAMHAELRELSQEDEDLAADVRRMLEAQDASNEAVEAAQRRANEARQHLEAEERQKAAALQQAEARLQRIKAEGADRAQRDACAAQERKRQQEKERRRLHQKQTELEAGLRAEQLRKAAAARKAAEYIQALARAESDSDSEDAFARIAEIARTPVAAKKYTRVEVRTPSSPGTSHAAVGAAAKPHTGAAQRPKRRVTAPRMTAASDDTDPSLHEAVSVGAEKSNPTTVRPRLTPAAAFDVVKSEQADRLVPDDDNRTVSASGITDTVAEIGPSPQKPPQRKKRATAAKKPPASLKATPEAAAHRPIKGLEEVASHQAEHLVNDDDARTCATGVTCIDTLAEVGPSPEKPLPAPKTKAKKSKPRTSLGGGTTTSTHVPIKDLEVVTSQQAEFLENDDDAKTTASGFMNDDRIADAGLSPSPEKRQRKQPAAAAAAAAKPRVSWGAGTEASTHIPIKDLDVVASHQAAHLVDDDDAKTCATGVTSVGADAGPSPERPRKTPKSKMPSEERPAKKPRTSLGGGTTTSTHVPIKDLEVVTSQQAELLENDDDAKTTASGFMNDDRIADAELGPSPKKSQRKQKGKVSRKPPGSPRAGTEASASLPIKELDVVASHQAEHLVNDDDARTCATGIAGIDALAGVDVGPSPEKPKGKKGKKGKRGLTTPQLQAAPPPVEDIPCTPEAAAATPETQKSRGEIATPASRQVPADTPRSAKPRKRMSKRAWAGSPSGRGQADLPTPESASKAKRARVSVKPPLPVFEATPGM